MFLFCICIPRLAGNTIVSDNLALCMPVVCFYVTEWESTVVVVVGNGVDKRKDLALNIMFVVSVFETRLPPSAAYLQASA